MSVNATVTTLKSLKLFGMAGAVAEVAEREVRSINYQMKIARFPVHRDLAGFEFKESTVNVALTKTPAPLRVPR